MKPIKKQPPKKKDSSEDDDIDDENNNDHDGSESICAYRFGGIVYTTA